MIFFREPFPEQSTWRAKITAAYRMDETECVQRLLDDLRFPSEINAEITELAKELVERVREKETEKTGIEALMMHYDLSSEEGILLMCLAESLLRIPDKETEDLLIRDKLTSANWQKHIGLSESSFVNIATWGLALTGKVLSAHKQQGYFKSLWYGLLQKSSEPVIREAVREAIRLMSEHFVLGRTIEEALKRSEEWVKKGYSFSYDMLGEVARTQQDADDYFTAYQQAIAEIGKMTRRQDLLHGPGISVKLSALYPRYEFSQRENAIPFLVQRLKTLCLQARDVDMSLAVDAEEADRLDLSLDIFEEVFADKEFVDWEGMGLAVQAYQKRAYYVIDWIIDLARKHKRRIQVRLVKGAYWDTEIKLSQVGGFESYPVFTRKSSTDVSYLACAKKMLLAQDAIYPQFATHNAYTVAAILTMMEGYHQYEFEFQKLQGMGKSLHDLLVDCDGYNIANRIYAPVGSHKDLLPYLIRRLLENGANSSFVNQLVNKNYPLEKLIADPIKKTQELSRIPNPNIPLPENIFGVGRKNSHGIDFSHYAHLHELSEHMQKAMQQEWCAWPFYPTQKPTKKALNSKITNPADRREVVGVIKEATPEDIEKAVETGVQSFVEWNNNSVEERAAILEKAATLIEKNHALLMAIALKEAGKNLYDAMSEVREATDFCYYYAKMARHLLVTEKLIGPTGESNQLRLLGRGVFVCISPWNFPIAIFTGQIAAALVTGNSVIAKPAEQTPLVAAKIVELFHDAGVPTEVLQLLPGRGEIVGAKLVADPRIGGVVFTGSTDTAKLIAQALAKREGPIVPLIAETGGVNAMIADSTALPEQLVLDVIQSAFNSAGQRCSALRVLFIQQEIADDVIAMLKGAMEELKVGNPLFLSTDVGPVIDIDAEKMLEQHSEKMEQNAKLIYHVALPPEAEFGNFVAPQAFELPDLTLLKREIFGPILHVIRFKKEELDHVIDVINDLGYGLTFGIQSRVDETIDYIQSRIRAGNIYVNRNMIGAVVGVQPFGGNRLSGTGPKAGGPHYLLRFCDENTLTINTVAMGGNASLMILED